MMARFLFGNNNKKDKKNLQRESHFTWEFCSHCGNPFATGDFQFTFSITNTESALYFISEIRIFFFSYFADGTSVEVGPRISSSLLGGSEIKVRTKNIHNAQIKWV